MRQTRWPIRRSPDFPRGTKAFTRKHLEAIESRVPGLAKDLERARKEWQSSFWSNADLPVTKSDSDQVALTAAEIASIREAIKELSGDPYATALYDDLEILVESGVTSASQLLNIEADLKDVKQSFAMDALRKRVEDFAFMVNQREQDYLNQLLDQGLSQGWTPKKLSSEIAQAFSDGYHITDDSGNVVRIIPNDVWSDTVARTEMARAQVLGQMALYQSAGVQQVLYVTTQGSNVCDICSPYDGQVFALNDAPEVPQHPNCCCAYMAADADLAYNPEEDKAA